MATTRLTDVITPEVFAAYVQVRSTELSAFVASGVIVDDPRLDEFLAGGGRLERLPYWSDLDDTEANVSSDDPAIDGVVDKLQAGQFDVVRTNYNRAWSAMDLTGALAGDDPMSAIVELVAGYWTRQEQTRLIRSVQGVIADSVANDSDDMINIISLPAGGTVLAEHLFSAEAVIDTIQTMGDHGTRLVAIAMHSVVYSRAKKNNLIDFIPDSANSAAAGFEVFQNLRVIVDDNLPNVANNGNVDFSTYLFAAGAFHRGTAPARVPVEVERQALAGTGGGQEFLVSRVQHVLHPWGMNWTDTTVGQSPSFAQLAREDNWDKTGANGVLMDRKLIPIAELRTNG